jgi:hypothetical protein
MGGTYVFDSPVFLEVSPPGGDRPPALVAKSFERSKIATVSVPKRGPDGNVVVFDDAGKMYGIVQVEGGSDPVFEVDDFKMPLATINAHGQLFFLDQAGMAIAVGSGQADRDRHVLMMQNAMQDNNLVYYMAQVNDVYAYFLTGTKNGKIMPPPTMFPASQMELNAVKMYARNHGIMSFPDEKALIVELKSSWIELPPGGNYGDYVSIEAQVPNFDELSDTHWKRKGLRPATLAMVGMHIAFSVKGHPELIWATFEHVNNAPNARYQYLDRRDFESLGPWLFSSGGNASANRPRMVMDGDDIKAIGGQTIGPSDVLRISPWGTYQAQFTPIPNAKVISTNNNVQGRLLHGDARKNYMLVGATWGMKLGSRHLANSTIETFVQPASCLDCHDVNTNKLGGSDGHGHGAGLSHVYDDPLFPDP